MLHADYVLHTTKQRENNCSYSVFQLEQILPPSKSSWSGLNCSPLLKQIHSDLQHWTNILLSIMGRISVMKITKLPKLNSFQWFQNSPPSPGLNPLDSSSLISAGKTTQEWNMTFYIRNGKKNLRRTWASEMHIFKKKILKWSFRLLSEVYISVMSFFYYMWSVFRCFSQQLVSTSCESTLLMS